MIDLHEVAQRFRAENEREERILGERRSRAAALGKELALRLLACHPESRRVWGFGSVFETWRDFRKTSDLDLAVESGDVIGLLALVENEEIEVDIVDLSACPRPLAETIRTQGIILAEERHRESL